jgi:hypothetical protein
MPVANQHPKSKRGPRISDLQQAIAYVSEGRGDLVPVFYLHFIRGMVDGALQRHGPRVV